MQLDKNKAVRLRNEATKFQSVIDSLKLLPFLQHYASAIRNTYNALQEAPEWTIEKTSTLKLVRTFARQTMGYLVRRPIFEPKAEVTMLSIHPIVDDPVSNLSGVPVTALTWERDKSMTNLLTNGLNLILPLLTLFALLCFRRLNASALLGSWPDLLDYTLTRNRLTISGLKVLITHRDRYGSEVGLVRKLRELRVPTIKVDYYSPLDAFCQNTIEAEHFFYPNDNNRGIYERYPHNRHVRYHPGGLPKWDLIGLQKYNPQKSPRIVLFMGQYDTEQFTGVNESFYIEKLLEHLPPGHQLYIKPHPSEKLENYLHFSEKGARIIRHGEIENYELIGMSTICFSVYSAMLYEAKHICETSYVINFFPELAPHVEYDFLKRYVDHVSTEQMLIDVLNGKYAPIPIPDFIGKFNPTFPNSSQALRQLAHNLSTQV